MSWRLFTAFLSGVAEWFSLWNQIPLTASVNCCDVGA